MHMGLLSQTTGFFPDYETPTTTAVGPTDVTAQTSPDWTTQIGQIVGYVTQWDMARQLYQLNLERAQQGLEPIQSADVTPGVNIGVSSDVKNLVMLGIAVAGGLFLFSALRR